MKNGDQCQLASGVVNRYSLRSDTARYASEWLVHRLHLRAWCTIVNIVEGEYPDLFSQFLGYA